jgi:hypothetical protein
MKKPIRNKGKLSAVFALKMTIFCSFLCCVCKITFLLGTPLKIHLSLQLNCLKNLKFHTYGYFPLQNQLQVNQNRHFFLSLKKWRMLHEKFAFWSERSACVALGCWHKQRWPLLVRAKCVRPAEQLRWPLF